MWIEPERTGLFLGQSPNIADPTFVDVVARLCDTPEEFARWLQEQKTLAASDPAVAAGRPHIEQTACINCHAVNGTVGTGRFGPIWTHLIDRDTLGSGVPRTRPENLRAWIKAPGQFKPGVLMPAYEPDDRD